MALSTSLSLTPNRNLVTLVLTVWEDDIRISDNTSRLNYRVNIYHAQGRRFDTSWYGYTSAIYMDFTIGGHNPGRLYLTKFNYGGECLNGHEYTSGNFRISHNDDGSKSIRLWMKAVDDADDISTGGNYYTPGDGETTSQDLWLETIARASQPSISGTTNMGSNMIVYTNRASTNFTHTADYSFGSASGRIGTGIGDNITWAVPLDLAYQISNATSGNGTITLYTYNGNQLIGTKTVGFTINVPSSVVPTISSNSISDINTEITKHNFGVFIAGKSRANLYASVSGAYGSSITKFKVIIEGQTIERSNLSDINNWLKNIILSAGSNKSYSIVITDSRGRISSTAVGTYNVNAYSSPTITGYNVFRSDSSGTAKDDGTYLKYSIMAAATNINNGKNKFSVRVGYKKKSASNYTYITILNASTSTFSVNNSGITGNGGIDSNSSYDVIFEVWDLLTASSTIKRTKDIGTGFDLVHYNVSGKAIAFGKKSEATGDRKLAEFGMDLDVKQALYINGIKTIWYE